MSSGTAMILTNLLTATFGNVPDWAAKQISEASPEQLSSWVRKVPGAQRIEDVIPRPK